MARRIIRRRKVARPAQPQSEPVRSSKFGSSETKAGSTTRTLIAAPMSVCTVLSSKLSGSFSADMAAMAQNEATAVEKMITEKIDVAAIHIHLGGELGGLEIARSVAKACPEAGILILVDTLDGIDLRRCARMFGTSWSYAALGSAQKEHAFSDMVNGVGRGLHWIDPGLRRVLEAVWQVASQGRDLEMVDALEDLNSGNAKKVPDTLLSPPSGPSQKGAIQTMRSGNSGVGSSFGINRAS